jgi:hypothetical protein
MLASSLRSTFRILPRSGRTACTHRNQHTATLGAAPLPERLRPRKQALQNHHDQVTQTSYLCLCALCGLRRRWVTWNMRSRPCLALPPAESPSTMKISDSAGLLLEQSASLPGSVERVSTFLRRTSSRAFFAASAAWGQPQRGSGRRAPRSSRGTAALPDTASAPRHPAERWAEFLLSSFTSTSIEMLDRNTFRTSNRQATTRPRPDGKHAA